MPAFISSNTEAEKVRNSIRLSWKEYANNLNVPVIILGMQDTNHTLDEYKSESIFVFQQKIGHHDLIAREIMCKIAKSLNFDYILAVDDDFLINSKFKEFSDSLLSLTSKTLFVSSRRLWFTSLRSKPVISGFINYIDDKTKIINKNVKPWEFYSNFEDVSNVLWMREGYFISVNDPSDVISRRLELFPKNMADRFVISGLDVLVLNKICMEEGLLIKSVTSHFHKTFREEDTGFNYSTCGKGSGIQIIDSPLSISASDKNFDKILHEYGKCDRYVNDIINTNLPEYNRLSNFSIGRSV
jgi:hypothetical protein